MIGLFDKFVPKFVKQYTNVRKVILNALDEYKQEVIDVKFPAPEHSFKMPEKAMEELMEILEK
jgi:3-methyl-2-oxobutanoate hydroxymethyltransferase